MAFDRRRLLAGAVASAASLPLRSIAAQDAAPTPVPIRIQTPDLAFVDALQQQLTAFQTGGNAPDLLLSIVPAESAPDGLLTDLRSNGGRFTGAIVPSWSMADLARGNWLAEASPPPVPLPEPLARLRSFGGQWVAADLDHACDLLYTRLDRLDSLNAALPETWEELASMLNETNLTIALPNSHASQVVDHFSSLAASVVGTEPFWFDPKTMDPLISSSAHQQALEIWRSLNVHAVAAQSTGDLWQSFADGDAAFLLASADAFPYLCAFTNDVTAIGVTPLPGARQHDGTIVRAGNTTGANWGGITISGGHKQATATAFLDSLAQPAAQLELWTDSESSIVPAAIDPAADASSAQDAGWPIEQTTAWLAALHQTWSEPIQLMPLRIAETRRYLMALERHIVQFLADDTASASSALSAAAEEWRSINVAIDIDVQRDLFERSLAPVPGF